MSEILVPRQVGQAVSESRRARGFTQEQLARKAHVSRQLINRLEMGNAANISLSRLMEVLAALGCTLRIDWEGVAEPLRAADSQRHGVASPAIAEPPSFDLDETLFAPRSRET